MQNRLWKNTLSLDTQKKIFFFPVFVYLFFFGNVGKSIAGDVVINEFLVDPTNTQWIELYNTSDTQIDISSWILDDDGGSQHFVIPSGTLLDSKSFQTFESGLFNLNKSTADSVRLIYNGAIEDSYGYTTGPPPNASFGREGDGGSNWVIFQTPTRNSSNNSSQSQVIQSPTSTPNPPTMTPISTNVPTPSRTPTPIKTPTPTRTPTPIRTPTPTKINILQTKTVTPTVKLSAVKLLSASGNTERDITALPDVTKVYPTAILGVKKSKKATSTSTSSKAAVLSEHTEKSDTNPLLYALPVIGAGLLSGGVFYYLKKRREDADAV